jgi:hypothetical protein
MMHASFTAHPAMLRMQSVIDAFNALEAMEQTLFLKTVPLILSAGMPVAPFEPDRIQSEAEAWAPWASAEELEAYALAIEDEMKRRAMAGGNELKRIFARLWRRLSDQDRAAFITHVTSGRAA